jgi:hypothetical protein
MKLSAGFSVVASREPMLHEQTSKHPCAWTRIYRIREEPCTGGSKAEEGPKDFFEWLYVCVQLLRKNDIRRVICNK